MKPKHTIPLILFMGGLTSACKSRPPEAAGSAVASADAATANSKEYPSAELTEITSGGENGLSLWGQETWPYLGERKFDYPADVIWGFNKEGENAKNCARSAHAALKAFMHNITPEMKEVASLGADTRFYLWINDFSQDELGRERPGRMWHWNSTGIKNYQNGYWKWEASLTKSGECLLPTDEQIKDALVVAIRVRKAQQK